jgi:membrane protease YdiL (CAAX protease family)
MGFKAPLTVPPQNESIPPVKRILQSDVMKLILYVVSCFLLAALLTPWIYNAGMFLAEFTTAGSTNSLFDWLGDKARGSDYPTFFKRALLLSALLLLAPLLFALRMSGHPAPLGNSPWTIYLPPHTVAQNDGQPLRNPPFGWMQLLTGFLLAGGLLLAMGLLLVFLGWFQWDEPISWSRAIKKSIPAALSASLIEEIIFRGALLGIFLRTFRPFWAIVLLSVLFAGMHFLQPPDDIAVFVRPTGPLLEGQVYIDPESGGAGFELLKLIGLRFTNPIPLLYEFATLALVGLILGYARFTTSSLWLPIGLHAGWVFAFKLFNAIADRNPDLDSRYDLYIGHDLKEGLVPLATLVITAILVHMFTRMIRDSAPPPRSGALTPEPNG